MTPEESSSRLEALHKQLDGSMSVLSMLGAGDFHLAPDRIMNPTGDAFAQCVFMNASANVMLCAFKTGAKWPLHEHIESLQYLICLSGEFRITSVLREGEFSVILTRTKCFRIPLGTLHEITTLVAGELLAICIPPEKGYVHG